MTDAAQRASNPPHRGYVPLRWVGVVLALLAAFVYLTGLTASPDDAGIAYQTIAAIAIIVVFAAVMVVCVLIYRRYVGTPLLDWPGWRRLLLEAAIAAPIATVSVLALTACAERLFPTMGAMDDLYKPVIIAPVVYSLVGFTVAPLAEEMLYRAVLYGCLRRWLRPAFAVVLQALVFGVMHRYGFIYMSMAFVCGLLFMGLYLWRRTLWSPILVHALINAVGAITLLVPLLLASGNTVLGISMARVGDQPGCRVAGVVPGSPADAAALKPGDVITAIDNHPIKDPNDARKVIAAHKHLDTIILTLQREGKALQITAELRARRPHVLW